MQELLFAAIGLLVLIVLVEGVAIFALFRQVGLLHLTLAGGTAGHLHSDEAEPILPIPDGSTVPTLEGTSIQGQLVGLGDLIGRRVLLAFVHPLCTPCNYLHPGDLLLDERGS